MEAHEINEENFVEGKSMEELQSMHQALEKLWVFSGADSMDTEVLRSRIDEQSTLICILKQRSDELLLRCQALQKINTELEDKITDCHKELEEERKKSEMLEKRFMVLAANNQAIIVFKDEYKSQNAELRRENQQLQSENKTLFSKKIQDKEDMVQSLEQEITQLKEKHALKEKDYCEITAELKAKLNKQAHDYKAKQASLIEKIQSGKDIQRKTLAMCNDLKAQLTKTKEELKSKEIDMIETIETLTKENDKLLHVSIERGKLIQQKQQEHEQMEIKWKEEKRLRTKSEERFKRETEAVNTDAKVRSLQCTLEVTTSKYENLKKDFEAFKEHSTKLLIQERELNKKLQLMTG